MPEIPEQTGAAASESQATPPKKKRTWLVCCCIGCLAGFITMGAIAVFCSTLLLELLRSLIVPR
jgi:hypothetical protein